MNFCFCYIQLNKITQALLFPICLFVFPSVLFAQSGIGFHIGKCYSKFNVVENDDIPIFNDYSKSFDHKAFFASLYYSYSFNSYLSLKPGLGYVKRGATILRSYGWANKDDRVSLEYLNASALVSFAPVKFLSLDCGVSYNYLIDATFYEESGRASHNTDFFNRFDLGLKGGVTGTVKNIFINVSYFRSFGPIWVIDLSAINPNIKNTEYQNRSIEVSFGYQLNIGRKNDLD